MAEGPCLCFGSRSSVLPHHLYLLNCKQFAPQNAIVDILSGLLVARKRHATTLGGCNQQSEKQGTMERPCQRKFKPLASQGPKTWPHTFRTERIVAANLRTGILDGDGQAWSWTSRGTGISGSARLTRPSLLAAIHSPMSLFGSSHWPAAADQEQKRHHLDCLRQQGERQVVNHLNYRISKTDGHISMCIHVLRTESIGAQKQFSSRQRNSICLQKIKTTLGGPLPENEIFVRVKNHHKNYESRYKIVPWRLPVTQ